MWKPGPTSHEKKPPDVAPAACEFARHGGMAVGIVCRIFDACVIRASAAVSAVVGLPHGLFRSLVFGFLVVSKKRRAPHVAGLSGSIAPGDQVEPVNPLLMTARTSSSDTPRRLSIS